MKIVTMKNFSTLHRQRQAAFVVPISILHFAKG